MCAREKCVCVCADEPTTDQPDTHAWIAVAIACVRMNALCECACSYYCACVCAYETREVAANGVAT